MYKFALLLLVTIAGLFSAVPVYAQETGGCVDGGAVQCATREQAFQYAESHASWWCGQAFGALCDHLDDLVETQTACNPTCGYVRVSYMIDFGRDGMQARFVGKFVYYVNSQCPNNAPWDSQTHTCLCPSGQAKINGECRECTSLNDDPNSVASLGVVTLPYESKCFGDAPTGCLLSRDSALGGSQVVIHYGSNPTRYYGNYRFTGSCPISAGDPPAPPPDWDKDTKPKEDCVPASDNQTFCLRNDGKHCYTSPSGKKTCWSPGETGQKGTDNELQVRGPGNTTPQPATPKTANGDTYQPDGSPISTTTTTNNTTVNTTTQNYGTENGTNADNQGAPGTEGGGDDDGKDETSASGGGDCKAPPVVSGDAALNMVANQAWATRCAVEAGNTAKVTGDVGDCASPFVVEGTNANAVKLRALRAQICGENQPGWTKGDGPQIPGDDGDEPTTKQGWISADLLDTSDLIGGGTCPAFTITIAAKTFTTAELPYWCNALVILRSLILLFGAYTAIRVLLGDS